MNRRIILASALLATTLASCGPKGNSGSTGGGYDGEKIVIRVDGGGDVGNFNTGRIYESRNKGHSNVVFVGFDKDGKARFGCLRGISEARFHGDLSGSRKALFLCPARPRGKSSSSSV